MNWLNHDHGNFELAVYKCRTACDASDWPLVQCTFREFASRYKSHMHAEEEVLFLAYDAHPGTTTDPTDSLKADHTQILRLMEHISELLDVGSYESLAEDLSLLYRTMIKHHEKEEEIFLPMASEALFPNKDTIHADLKRHITARD